MKEAFSRKSKALRCGVSAVILTAAAVLLAGGALADGTSKPPSRAQQLAAKSLESLQDGEDAETIEGKMKAYRRGVDLAEQAIAADDNNADAHFALFANQGRIMLYEGAVPNPVTLMIANRELNRALEIDPNHADALAAKGGMYRQLPWALGGSNEKASEYLARSVELDYENACGARIELAELYRDLGYPERSIPLLQKAVEIARRDKKTDKLQRARALLEELDAQ